jgi:hypothetical protein
MDNATSKPVKHNVLSDAKLMSPIELGPDRAQDLRQVAAPAMGSTFADREPI